MSGWPRDLLLLHGFTHTGASWDQVRAALPRGYRAVTPDLRGHGSATAAEPVTLDAVLDDLAVVAPDGAFVVGGYSQGGRLALHAALDERMRERVVGLVLVGASPGIADREERQARRKADERLAVEIEGSSIEEFARRWSASPVLSGLPGHLARQVHRDRLRSTPQGLARALRGLGTGALPSLWDRLGEVEVPAMLVVGERDRKFREIAQRMAGQMPKARVCVVPAAGHAVHVERPESVADLLSAAGMRGAHPG